MMERQLGRESQKDNDLFYTCSLIDYIARKTKNKRAAVVDALGKECIAKIYDLADIYHSDNIERVSDDFIDEDIWLGMLKSRNDLTHIYDESSARRLVMIL